MRFNLVSSVFKGNFLCRTKQFNKSIRGCYKPWFSGMDRQSFNFMKYDAIGFDLDHTICQYNLENIMKLQYRLLVSYLVTKGYPAEIFSKELTKEDIDFIQRGLFLDFNRGNILYVSEDGTIVKGSHGSRDLSDSEIIEMYGNSKKWEPITMFVEDKLSVWEPPWSDAMRSMMDFTDSQVPLVFAQIIDYVDRHRPSPESYAIWPIILDGIVDMFKPGGSYYLNLYKNPHLYLKICKPYIVEWMSNLRKAKKCLFLLTGARKREAAFLANYSLGKNWKELFDFIVYDAKKPGFFTKDRPFLDFDYKSQILSDTQELTRGNWQGLHSLISLKMAVPSPKCVYIGDNLLQDVYVTSLVPNIDSIAMVEELCEEDFLLGKFEKHPNSEYVKSHRWYSYIFTPSAALTIWGSIIRNHSKLCIPSLDFIAKKPIDYSFIPFWTEASKY